MNRFLRARAVTVSATLSCALAWVLVSTLVLGWAHGGTAIERPLQELLERADRAIEAEVEAVDTVQEEDGTVWTVATLRILAEPIGTPADEDARTEVRFLGGDGTFVDDLPRPQAGERVVAFLYDAEGLASPVVGGWQGWFLLTPEGYRDPAGRVLGATDAGVTLGGGDPDAGAVLRALAEGRTQPPSEEPADVGADADPAADTDDREVREPAEPLELAVHADERIRPFLQRAADAWNEAGVPVRLSFQEDAPDRIELLASERFGPDLLALTLVRAETHGRELRVRADALARDDLAMVTLAWLAGAPLPSLPSDGRLLPAEPRPYSPSDEDLAAWQRVREGPAVDLVGDQVTSFYDLVRLAEAYGQSGTRVPEDLDRSGTVDDADLRILRQAYEFLPPSRDAPEGWRDGD